MYPSTHCVCQSVRSKNTAATLLRQMKMLQASSMRKGYYNQSLHNIITQQQAPKNVTGKKKKSVAPETRDI